MRARRVLAPLVIAAVVAACSGGGDDAPLDGSGYTSGFEAALPGGGRVTSTSGGSIEVRYTLDRPDVLTVSIDAPDDADEMQVSTDAGFGDAEWRAVEREVELPVRDTGYVQVFARFRGAAGGTSTDAVVAAVYVDPAWAAATQASADAPHVPALVGLAAPDVLAVRVESGRIIRGGQEQYSFASPAPGDEIREGDEGALEVWRDGALYGTQVAPELDLIKRPDVVLGFPVDVKRLRDRGDYSIDGPNGSIRVEAVNIVSRPTGTATTDVGDVRPATHDVYIHLERTIEPGTYEIQFPRGVLAPTAFTFDPMSSHSFAVHANQVGYRPEDALKVAYVSAWDGAAIEIPENLGFSVVSAEDGEVVFEGTSTMRTTGDDGEYGRGDLTGTTVQELDFSSLDEPGTYRVCVETLGCSYEFSVSESSTWRRAAVAVARAMYHQRSGIELREPYTSVSRPRGFHPDEGVEVRQASASAMEIDAANESDAGGFGTLVDSATDTIVPEAWGGHFDAGDWDRRVQHLSYLRTALDLVEQYPDTWATLELGIPESGDAIPDIIDEGLWDLDMFRRLQMPDGGIRGGIESDEHPLPRQTSWTQTQQTFVFAPDAESSYIYAGVAAETARVLAEYDAARANEYAESALAAMAWAEDHPVTGDDAEDVEQMRAMAAAALFRLTGDPQWQDVFIDATPFEDGPLDLLGCEAHKLCDAAWIYANTDNAAIDDDVKANVIESFRRNATALADAQDTALFGWSMEHPYIPLVWGLGPSVPKTVGLLRGYTLTGDTRFCRAAMRSATFSLGANPLDTVFLTGVGMRNVRQPLIVDNINGAVPVWPGTPVYGLHQLNEVSDESWVTEYQLRPAGTSPDPDAVPYLQSWWDLSSVPMMNEFTVHQSHAAALYAYGSLAGLDCSR